MTRARGMEAFERLSALVERSRVDLMLDGVDLLSASFLDEIVRLLGSMGKAENVTFVTGNSVTLNKLERIVSVRNARIYARQPQESDRWLVRPRDPVAPPPTFSLSKEPGPSR